METTAIAPERTALEIQAALVSAGAKQIATDYGNGKITGLRWFMATPAGDMLFALPVRVMPLYELLCKRRGVNPKYGGTPLMQKAERVAWRQLLRWVLAQLAMVETGMVSAGEVFSPYAEVAPGKTMWAAIQESRQLALPAPNDLSAGMGSQKV